MIKAVCTSQGYNASLVIGSAPILHCNWEYHSQLVAQPEADFAITWSYGKELHWWLISLWALRNHGDFVYSIANKHYKERRKNKYQHNLSKSHLTPMIIFDKYCVIMLKIAPCPYMEKLWWFTCVQNTDSYITNSNKFAFTICDNLT